MQIFAKYKHSPVGNHVKDSNFTISLYTYAIHFALVIFTLPKMYPLCECAVNSSSICDCKLEFRVLVELFQISMLHRE